MRAIVHGIWERFKKSSFLRNTSWIFWGNVIYSVLNFLLGILVARLISVEDNGRLSYATTLVTFASAFVGLGFSSVITKFFADSEEEAGADMFTCTVSQTAISLVAVGVLWIYMAIRYPTDGMMRAVVVCSSLTMLTSPASILVYWYQYKQRADVAAKVRIGAFLIAFVLRIAAIGVLHNLVLYVCIGLVESILYVGTLFVRYVKDYGLKVSFSFARLKRLLSVSYPFISTAILITIYGHTDTLMLQDMMGSRAVAMYGVSLRIATLTSTIPSTLVEAFRPDIMRFQKSNHYLYEKRMRQLYAIIFWSSMAYGFAVLLLRRPIILILYGQKYLEAANYLPIIVWYSAFSYFGAINNVYMVAEGKAKWVQMITLCGALINVALNYVLIPVLGVAGAAIASLATQFISHFVIFSAIPTMRSGAKNMIKAILLRDVV